MKTFGTGSMFKRTVITFGFAVICIAIGFILATGWETPTRVVEQHQYSYPKVDVDKIPVIDEEGNSPFVHVAEAVKPVVVNVTAEKAIKGHQGIPFDVFDWGPFFGQPPDKRMETPHITQGGSGIIIDIEGHILTNNHVVADAEEITVKLADKSEYSAKIIGSDSETDIALIKLDGKVSPEMVAKLGDSDKIRIGEWAIAVGNPFGLDWTVTVGVISARGRSNLAIGGATGPSYQDFIQTDASINFGNSGGPLLNIRGEVIGVNTAINAAGQGIGFAIPINLASKVVAQLKESGEVRRGYLGIFPSELDEIKREALGIDDDIKGIFVDGVQENTPADEEGLRGGEVIIEVDGTPVEDVTGFRFLIADYPPHSKVKMKVWRDGKSKNITFTLAERSEFVNRTDAPQMKSEQLWFGIEVTPTDGVLGRRLGLEDIKGVLVVRIAPESPASGLLEGGDVIVEVGGVQIENVEDYLKAIEKVKDRKKAIPFWIYRNGLRTFVPIRP